MSKDAPALFESDVWHQISEARVDAGRKSLTHNLQIQDSPPAMRVFPSDGNWWQFIPTGDGIEHRYHLRSQKSGTAYHLAACYHPEEEHPDKTRLCLSPAKEGDEAQMWEIFDWGEGTTALKFLNVANGTNHYLDVHKGADPYMNDDIDTDVFKPAQRWLVSSVDDIDDPAFLVSATEAPEATGSSSSSGVPANETPADGAGQELPSSEGESSSDSSSSGISTGAAAGIGVGVGAAVLLGIAAIFFLLRRKRRSGPPAVGEAAWAPEKKPDFLAEAAVHEPAAHEVLGQTHYPREGVAELDSTPTGYQTGHGLQTPLARSPEQHVVSPLAKSPGDSVI